MKIISIAGGSASGKSSFARRLQNRIGTDKANLICEDDYYLGAVEGNFDHIDTKDHALILSHINDLKAGNSIEVPRYDMKIHDRSEEVEVMEPKDVLILEGTQILYRKKLSRIADCKVYIDAPDDIRLARRMARDIIERKRDPEDIINQYLEQVKPMHYRYTYPSKYVADVIINNEFSMYKNPSRLDRYIEIIINRVMGSEETV